MSIQSHLSSVTPWPAEPAPDSPQEERLVWYASVARWAPSKHNSQPWRFVVRDDALWVWPDTDRGTPDTDPMQRELLIGCGAAVHLACVAARALGHELELTWLPEPGSQLVAKLTERGIRPPAVEDRELLNAIAQRRTDRGPLDATGLPAGFPFALQSLAASLGTSFHLVQSEGDRSTLASLVAQADRLLVRQGVIDEELAVWRREEGDTRPDGVPSDHTRGAAASYRAEFVQRDFSAGGGSPVAMDRGTVDAPLVGVLCTPGDTVIDWLIAGRALASLLLSITKAGANASYLNQPCEEPRIRSELRDALRLDGRPQLVLRFGVGGHVVPTPRREIAHVVTREGGR